MDFDNDRLLLARATLSDLVEALRLTHFDNSPVLFLTRLEAIRETAKIQRFDAVAEIAASFEDAMQRVIRRGGAESVIESYLEILREAIGCSNLDAVIAESLLASVAIRLRA
ncbi:MAG: hypothetical protein HC843_07580 [Sphingomonadales bacterium]|nr:hypothetical protein [Sphingomonadales bacterium]